MSSSNDITPIITEERHSTRYIHFIPIIGKHLSIKNIQIQHSARVAVRRKKATGQSAGLDMGNVIEAIVIACSEQLSNTNTFNSNSTRRLCAIIFEK